MAEPTPMMRQFLEIKERCQDCILFFRLGDFYEMFFQDAEIASRELELVLTGKDCGLAERAPMCGVPYHAALSYIGKLVSKGYKVAVCEQMEDPALAKGIVKRDIVRIYTPGTVTDEQMLSQKRNNFIAAIYEFRNMYGISAADITTGEMYLTSLTVGSTYNHLANEIARFAPSEIIINAQAQSIEKIKNFAGTLGNSYVAPAPEELFEYENGKEHLSDIRLGGDSKTLLPKILKDELAVRACGALISYMEDTQKTHLSDQITANHYKVDEYMAIDASSRRNLEITETLRDKNKKGSLLWVLDKTVTSMGARTLKKWLEQPLIDADAINARLDAVAELKDAFILRSEIREMLCGIYDMERIAGKITLGTCNARDMVSLRQSAGKLPSIKETLSACNAPLLKTLNNEIDSLSDVWELLEKAIADEPPVVLKEGGLIKKGYNAEVDECREASVNGKMWLAELEAKEREETGIKNLKISYNKVFGYYLEVTKSYLHLVPSHYIRKQTLVNNERYITDELKKMEDTILGAEERLTRLEFEVFCSIREYVLAQADRLRATANAVARLDALASYAETADRENYCRPEICTDESTEISIKDGRHPVVEKMNASGEFIPNDVLLDCDENLLLVITGPNMAGKSTYMRQVALMILMAQAGSFIPASEAKFSIVDKLFTRVGASDDLASGQSTFMVEMSEVANILSNATPKSFLILDEIGRGTSTFDGLSIAWAVLEYISHTLKSRAMFATHYHELTELEGTVAGVKNYCVDVKKKGDDIVFLRKMKRGGADGSYGISVAALAGIPKVVTLRAKEILEQLEEQDGGKGSKKPKAKSRNSGAERAEEQLDLLSFTANSVMQDEIISELKEIDVQSLTPIEALNILYRLHQKAEKRI
ncbi:MAG: DNA mismatch repair protein MutS [Ruminococcaceae bacterium]|nr:DNA mismatch repair protein MutS [Oscillospiraceae bacterium]